MPSPRWWRPTGGDSSENDTNSRTSAGSSSGSRAASSSTSSHFATARTASSAGSGSRIARLQPRPLQRRQPRIGRDVVRRAQAEAVVPYGRLACERRARRVGAVVRLLRETDLEHRIDLQVVLKEASPVQEPDTNLGIRGSKRRPDRLVDDDPIDQPNVADIADGGAQLSPVLSQRRWEQEAEANVLERLEAIGLLAPAGEADRVLETVLNNLVVTNKVNVQRPLHARILLTSPFESFTVGHTIVMSRGLITCCPTKRALRRCSRTS